MPDMRLKVLYPRNFFDKQGNRGSSWMQVGRAYMNSKGVDIQLWVVPLPNSDEGHIKLILREDDGRPAQDSGYRGEPGGREVARERMGQAFQGASQGRPQGAPQGGSLAPAGPGLRPQHRDGLQGAQGATYGGAAAAQTGWDLSGQGNDDGDPEAPF